MNVEGTCDAQFQTVRDEFERNFQERGEVGASICIVPQSRFARLSTPESSGQGFQSIPTGLLPTIPSQPVRSREPTPLRRSRARWAGWNSTESMGWP